MIREIPKLNIEEKQRFLSKIIFSKGCWNFKGASKTKGYKDFHFRGKSYFAHRVAYEVFNAEKLDTSLVVDHLCKNTACVNPAHLEQVTFQENLRRGDGISAIRARQTHCSKGHPWNEENTIRFYRKRFEDVVRVCRACKSEIRKDYYRRKRK